LCAVLGGGSASEVLAGALHDDCRALLMGSRSFGKGLIQAVYGLVSHCPLHVVSPVYQKTKHLMGSRSSGKKAHAGRLRTGELFHSYTNVLQHSQCSRLVNWVI
jgi:Peptidase family S41